MDKNAIKKYAVWARNELIARVSQKAQQYGITAEGYGDKNADSVNGVLLSATEKKQRQALIAKIDAEGFEQVMEEVAYTWFNRFTALRFMEVNNYLPSHTRVFTNEANEFKPQILADAISLEIEGIDMNKVFELKDANKDEELYKYLLTVQCNALSSILPGMFQKIADYTELLLPDYLLREGSAIEQMISLIPESDWTEQVQIIGWLYQYYNVEPKDEVFAKLKKKIKVTKETLPAATQLFTPDWIVRYMVENSLGRLWSEGHPGVKTEEMWNYYIPECQQNEEVASKIRIIADEYKTLNPEDIKCIDPCSGSGHILCYMFDVLVQIYESYGYGAREAVALIVEKNIWGLDIDTRASQLAYFAVMMKARQYDRRFFSRNIQPHVMVVYESNSINRDVVAYFCDTEELKADIDKILKCMKDAKEYGSLVEVPSVNWEKIYARVNAIKDEISMFKYAVEDDLCPVIDSAFILAQRYDVVVTNPPYMAISNGSPKLIDYAKDKYPNSKSDLFAVFIERCKKLIKENRFQAMITQHSWMFLSSFEKLRDELQQVDIVNMAHLGPRAFEEIGGEVVQTTSFVLRKSHISEYKGTYVRLLSAQSQNAKEKMFLARENRFETSQSTFQKIPKSPVAYWVSDKFIEAFKHHTIGEVAKPRQGLATGCNDIFLRQWYEVDKACINFGAHSLDEAISSGHKWFPYNKGGEFRKWYGNNDYVVNWENDGFLIRNFKNEQGKLRSRPQNTQFYFRECASWSLISTGTVAFRYKPYGHIFDIAGMSCFTDKNLKYILGLCNTPVVMAVLDVLAPTINFQAGDIANIPVIFDEQSIPEVEKLVDDNIAISKEDWDSFETSWDFTRHPLLKYDCETVQAAFEKWEKDCESRHNRMKQNEERLNTIFISIYGLENELKPEVNAEQITVSIASKEREIRSLISYAVGCMLGRYSLKNDGVCCTGGRYNPNDYSEFMPDVDNIIPICDDEYFEDDIVGLFVKFISVAFGKKYLKENLEYIATALGGSGTPSEVIRNYFINDFYLDHIKIYQKRPIYWLFDSGKKNGFKCLIYSHRYQADCLARIRTDYVHEQQSRYRTAISDLEQRLTHATTNEKVQIDKQLKKIREQSDEIKSFEELIHHYADQMIAIDIDDGVKTNYEIFKDVLAKIK